ncbi:MAG: hypothetical protein ACI8PZ_001898 [Myxococcota bacterium]|jgi:hypothetical protein
MRRGSVLVLLLLGCDASVEPTKPIDTGVGGAPLTTGAPSTRPSTGTATGGSTGDTSTTTTPGTTDPFSDADGDGIIDTVEREGGDPDTDGDGTPDWLDLDSDDDGIDDAEEGDDDIDFDGVGCWRDRDSDGDDIDDRREGAGGLPDTDGDLLPDYRDDDSDADGIPDAYEGYPKSPAGDPPDFDGDAVYDFRDRDSDDDSLLDVHEGIGDLDGDGLGDWRDPRNDNPTPAVTFIAISTPFNAPIGIDFHEPSGEVVMSVNYPSGTPHVIEQVDADGVHVQFSPMSGLTDEVKIATARSGNAGGFRAGDLFIGNGRDGEIVRVTDDGLTVIDPWVSLPGEGNGLIRGSLYVDRTGAWGGELIVCTTDGEVWRVDAAGAARLVADIPGIHLEGLVTVPDAPARYGPLAGRVLAGAEAVGLLYAFLPDGSYDAWSVGVNVEDIDMINGENFFGINYGTSELLGVDSLDFDPMIGDILLTQEGHSGTGLYRLRYDGVGLITDEIPATPDSAVIGQWEHVSFADAAIVEVN